MAQWYTTPRGSARLAMEKELVEIDFPGFRLYILEDGTAAFSGQIGPGDMLWNSYNVLAEYPYSYGNGNRIRVYLPYEKFPSRTPHLYPGGEICLDHNDFKRDDTIVTVLGWMTQWLILYEEFKRTGKRW